MPRTANIKRRPDGLYQRSITIGRKPDGSPIRKTIYAHTLKELEARATVYEQQLRHGTLSSDEKMTFGELAEIWLTNYKPTVSEGVRKRYRCVVENHLGELLGFKLRDLKPHHLQAIINRLAEQGRSWKMLKEVKATASQITEVALENDIIFKNPFLKIDIPSIDAEERRALRPEEVELITSTYEGHRMGLPALLMLYCGLRRGELLALTWSDINLKSKILTVNKAVFFDGNSSNLKTPKTKAGTRTVPIPDILLSALQGRRAASMMVCPSSSGEMMTQIAFKRAWESYLHYLNLQAGGSDKKRGKNNTANKPVWIPAVKAVENITPHMLRHTYATLLYDAGVDVKSAQRFLGHADLETTLKIYTHLSEQREQKSVDALNVHLGSKNSPILPLKKS